MRPNKNTKRVKRKTNKELAEYLSFIHPHNEQIYKAIAEFLGEDALVFEGIREIGEGR